MPYLTKRIMPLIVLGIITTTPAVQAEDATVNRLLASQCAQCHGTNGYSAGNIESIAGEEAKDLYEDLIDMRSEAYPEKIMEHQAFGYTEDQIRRIASFYNTLPESNGSGPGGSGSDGSGSEGSESEEKPRHRRSHQEDSHKYSDRKKRRSSHED